MANRRTTVQMTDEQDTRTPTSVFGLEVLVVDDHTIVRDGLKRVLSAADADWAVTEAGTGYQALDCLRRQRFDLAIVDLSMPGMSGLDLIQRIRAEHPAVRVLVLSMHAEEQYAMRAFKAGANGYVTKDSAATELVHAVRKIAGGGAYVTPSLAERVVQELNRESRPAPHAALSDRELEVLKRIVAGERPTEIAAALNLSIKTISTHKSRIQDKLQLGSTAALVRYGLEQGLLPGDMGISQRGAKLAD